MQDRAPLNPDNRRATGIAVASLAALLLAVALAHFGVMSPQKLEARDKAVVPAALPADTSRAPLPKTETGKASWYDFDGQKTANGEIMDADRLTAAHPTLPFGTKVTVENVENGRVVVARVNDRGPYADDERIIDLSKGAAHKLDMVEDGVTEVMVAPVPSDDVDDPGAPIQ